MHIQILLILNMLIILVNADNGNSIKFTNLKCNSLDENFVVFRKCRLRAVKRPLHTLSVSAEFFKSTGKHAKIRFTILKYANGYKPFLIDTTFDMCYFLSGRGGPLYKPFFDMAIPYWNLNKSCPISSIFIVDSLPIDATKIPSTWPAGDYRADIVLSTNGIRRSLVSTYVSVTENF